MNTYIAISAAFVLLGIYILLLFRGWHHHLVNLAQSLELSYRRRKAALHYPVVVILFTAPGLSVVIWSLGCVRAAHGPLLLLPIFLFPAIAPGIVWWLKHWPTLKNLGYGQSR